MATTLDYIKNLREQKKNEYGIPQAEAEVSAAENYVGDRIIGKAQDVEKFRGQLAGSQVVKDLEKDIASGTAELWKHYSDLKQRTMNPEDKDYIFTNPANTFDIIQDRLSPRRQDLMEKGLERERFFRDNESFAQRYEGILSQLLEADQLKLEAKKNALARAIQKAADDVDFEFKIYDAEQAAKKASGTGKGKSVYDKYSIDELAYVRKGISEAKAQNKTRDEIRQMISEEGYDPADFESELEGYYYQMPDTTTDKETGLPSFTNFSGSDDVIIEENKPAKKSFWQRLFGG